MVIERKQVVRGPEHLFKLFLLTPHVEIARGLLNE